MTAESKKNPSGFRRTGRIKALTEERWVKAEKWDALVELVTKTGAYSYGSGREFEGWVQDDLSDILSGTKDLVELIDDKVHPNRLTATEFRRKFWRVQLNGIVAIVRQGFLPTLEKLSGIPETWDPELSWGGDDE